MYNSYTDSDGTTFSVTVSCESVIAVATVMVNNKTLLLFPSYILIASATFR